MGYWGSSAPARSIASLPAAPDLGDRLLWGDLVAGSRRIGEGMREAARMWQDALGDASAQWPVLLGGFAVLAALVLAVRQWLLPAVRARMLARWSGHRLGESLSALVSVVVGGLVAWLAASLLLQLFVWAAQPEPAVRAMARTLVAVATLMAVITATGRGLLRIATAGAPAWPGARALRPAPYVIALALLVAALFDQYALLDPASAAMSGAARFASVPVLAIAIAFLLTRSAHALNTYDDHGDVARRRVVHIARAVVLLGWGLLFLVVAGLLTGYVSLAALVAKQTVWSLVVLGWLLLAWRTIHDAGDLLTSRREGLMQWSRRLGVGTRRLQQVVVLAAGAMTLIVVCLAVTLLTAPYGLGPDDLLGRLFDEGGRLRIGNLSFSPLQLLRAVFVLALAIVGGRLLARWMSCRLLPTTRLDAGVQASVTTLVGYVGVIVGIGLALAALGVEANRITWIVSALTVGIGFGLQAIVQNFISGLILLIERPVKVGDWVVVGDAEGDVRRINVRATEIALADRTTVLVPNSELITKTVRNRTFTAGDGLVKLVLPVPAVANVEQVVGIVRAVVLEQRELKSAPAPQVQLEDIKDNKVWIGVSAYVDGPRQVNRIRAELLYALVQRLQASGVALA